MLHQPKPLFLGRSCPHRCTLFAERFAKLHAVNWRTLDIITWRVLPRVNRLSDGRDLTVSAGRLAKSPCPLSQFLLRTSVSHLTYTVRKNGLVDTGFKVPIKHINLYNSLKYVKHVGITQIEGRPYISHGKSMKSTKAWLRYI